ncbi:transposon Tf2-11 polyprotein [Trichonephila clavipes]|nr:transposon Tf2-11 polyprotein [Trichonephila clavipes]
MSAVSIKIPPFWTDRPEIWFYQVEAQFQISRIYLEETKFHYLVSQLEPKYVENIWDIVNSKSDTKYTDSKNRLLSLFKESENLRIKRLLTELNLRFLQLENLLDCGEATSSRDQLLLNRIQSLEEQICQLSILHKSRTKERNSFHPKSRSRSRKRFDPKGKYCYFHFRFGARCKPEKCSPPCTWNRNTENFSLQ